MKDISCPKRESGYHHWVLGMKGERCMLCAATQTNTTSNLDLEKTYTPPKRRENDEFVDLS